MSTFFERIGELLGIKQPKQASMPKMTEMEQMPEMNQMMEMEQMAGMGQMTEMQQMTGMEQHEHPSNDMAANPGEMKMTQDQPDGHRERS